MIFVCGATANYRQYADHPSFGRLITPRSGHSIKASSGDNKPWGADNDAFGGWDHKKELAFSRMLGRICRDGKRETCRFVAAPDVVGDSEATMRQFDAWGSIIRSSGLPVALVAQDGLTAADVPWDSIDSLFIGGTTEFKLSRESDDLISAAKRLGKWVHVGRVNTLKRIRHFHDIGVDSFDGSKFSRWPDEYFPQVARWLAGLGSQKILY